MFPNYQTWISEIVHNKNVSSKAKIRLTWAEKQLSKVKVGAGWWYETIAVTVFLASAFLDSSNSTFSIKIYTDFYTKYTAG